MQQQRRLRNQMLIVSVLFNEPKLLKFCIAIASLSALHRFSALQRAEIAEIEHLYQYVFFPKQVSVLFNEPKLLKSSARFGQRVSERPVSVLFNEPKLLKSRI